MLRNIADYKLQIKIVTPTGTPVTLRGHQCYITYGVQPKGMTTMRIELHMFGKKYLIYLPKHAVKKFLKVDNYWGSNQTLTAKQLDFLKLYPENYPYLLRARHLTEIPEELVRTGNRILAREKMKAEARAAKRLNTSSATPITTSPAEPRNPTEAIPAEPKSESEVKNSKTDNDFYKQPRSPLQFMPKKREVK